MRQFLQKQLASVVNLEDEDGDKLIKIDLYKYTRARKCSKT